MSDDATDAQLGKIHALRRELWGDTPSARKEFLAFFDNKFERHYVLVEEALESLLMEEASDLIDALEEELS